MAIEAFLIKQPHEVSFTGNAMPYTFSLSPYGSTERNQDIRFIARVMLEDVFGSNNFNEIQSQPFYPNDKGEISFDVKKIVQPYLEYYTPNPSLARPVQALYQRKRYRVDYLIQKDGALVGSVEETDVLYAIKGGMSYDEWHPKEFFTSLVLDKKAALQFEPKRKIAFDELRYFFWIYPYADLKEQTVMIDILLNDQTTVHYDLPKKVFCGKWGVCCTPIGFNQLKLNEKVPAGLHAISYQVKVNNAANTAIVAPFQFELEQRNTYNPSQLLFRNSLGGIETITLRGQVDFETEFSRQSIQRTTPPAYFTNMVLNHQVDDVNATEAPKYKGDTGFLTREGSDRLRDFFLSKQKYEVFTGDDDNKTKLLPVTVAVKNTKFFSNNENLVTTLIEWQRAYINEFYTPQKTMPSLRACPAVEKLFAKQINKNLLSIMYALESPYSIAELEIETSLGIQTFPLIIGNTRSLRQAFVNPKLGTEETEEITIRLRTVCDENSDPMDVGPWKTITLVVIGNSLPVANDDTYNITVGYNTGIVLAGSALANDYDPDGDPIEVVAQVAQASHEGGTYSINAAGIITYQPPSDVWSGQDYFDYNIREVGGSGTTVTGRVYINVGTVAGAVYGKIVRRNVVSGTSGYFTEVTGEVWVDFFADPAGAIPLDVTGMGITFDVNEHLMIQDHNTGIQTHSDTAIPVLGVGTKVKFFDNVLYQEDMDPYYPYPQIMSIMHTLLPGTGYIVI